MRINGTLQYNRTTGGGFDASRNPIKATTSWSEPIDCMISRTGKSNLYNGADGKFVASHFEVQIEEEPLTILVTELMEVVTTVTGAAVPLGETPFYMHTLIRLTDVRGLYLGEFPLLTPNIVHMDTLERLKLIV